MSIKSNELAHNQYFHLGFGIFNIDSTGHYEIQALDESPIFTGDDRDAQAVQYVETNQNIPECKATLQFLKKSAIKLQNKGK